MTQIRDRPDRAVVYSQSTEQHLADPDDWIAAGSALNIAERFILSCDGIAGFPAVGTARDDVRPASGSWVTAKADRVRCRRRPSPYQLADLDALLGVAHGPVPDIAGSDSATATRTLMSDVNGGTSAVQRPTDTA